MCKLANYLWKHAVANIPICFCCADHECLFLPTQMKALSHADENLDNFSDQSGLDYTDYVQAIQVKKTYSADENLVWSGLKRWREVHSPKCRRQPSQCGKRFRSCSSAQYKDKWSQNSSLRFWGANEIKAVQSNWNQGPIKLACEILRKKLEMRMSPV